MRLVKIELKGKEYLHQKHILRTFWGLEQRSTACANTCCGLVPFRPPACRPRLGRHVRLQTNTGTTYAQRDSGILTGSEGFLWLKFG